MARAPTLTKEALLTLGAERLAELALDEAAQNAPFKKLVLAALAATRGPDAVAAIVDKRLAGLEKARSAVGWGRGKSFADDLWVGERMSRKCTGEGAKVRAAARRKAEGAALERRLGISFVRTDVGREDDVKAMVAHALARFRRVDCLVNNAGAGLPLVGVADIDMSTFDAVIAANVRGVLLGMKHVAPTMLAPKSGPDFRGPAAHHAAMIREACVGPFADPAQDAT